MLFILAFLPLFLVLLRGFKVGFLRSLREKPGESALSVVLERIPPRYRKPVAICYVGLALFVAAKVKGLL